MLDIQRFPIRFDAWYRLLSSALLISPSTSFVELNGDHVNARMGWAFRARFPRSAVATVNESHMAVLSRGVHGFGGRWLVNGSSKGLVTIDLVPAQRASMMGFPIRLRQLIVSVEDPAGLAAMIRKPHAAGHAAPSHQSSGVDTMPR
jgi:hypothetical protein